MSKKTKSRETGICWDKLLAGLILIPAGAGLTIVLLGYLRHFCIVYIPFFLGILSYTLIYPVFKKPLSSYVIGHELTHVLWVWLFRGRVHKVRVSRRGGMVQADRVNFWIELAPYFFPIYTITAVGVYLILSILWGMNRYFNLFAFILGLTWAFHLWMTVYVLRYNQPDIQASGILFSAVLIYTVNLIVLILLLVFISPELSFQGFICQSGSRVRESYLWILHRLT